MICAGESEWSAAPSPSPSTKRLLNSAHLVSRGAVVWSAGDVVASLGAAFVNQGTLLLLSDGDASKRTSPALPLPEYEGHGRERMPA